MGVLAILPFYFLVILLRAPDRGGSVCLNNPVAWMALFFSEFNAARYLPIQDIAKIIEQAYK
jgi:hypothetical protein